jgi:hypothetical protein
MAAVVVLFETDEARQGRARQGRKLAYRVLLNLQILKEGACVSRPVLVQPVLLSDGPRAAQRRQMEVSDRGVVKPRRQSTLRKSLLARQRQFADIHDVGYGSVFKARDE